MQPNKEAVDILIHELAQPLTTISAYLWSSIYRLTNDTPDREPILRAMKKAMQDIEHAQQILLRMNNCSSQVETN